MKIYDTDTVLDRAQLRDITLDDSGLMRELLAALIDDVSHRMLQVEAAIAARDADWCRRLVHSSKGACANIGANAAAAALSEMERHAANGEFACCSESLAAMAEHLERLRTEADSL